MTTAYTSLLGLALPVTGELSGTWGDTVNTAITSLLDTAVAGTTSITTDADITLTTTTGASNQARQAILLWNPASGTTTRYITAPAQSKLYTVINASGGTQSIVIRGVGPTTGVTIAKGESAMVAWNGSDFVKVSSSGGALTLTDLTVTGNTILGDAAADTLTVNATSTFASPVNFQGLVKLPSTGRSAAAALTTTNPAFLYGVASTYTDTTSSGTVAFAPFYLLAQPTLSTSNVTTYTNAATLYIANAPAAGGSATITNPYALYVASGASYFGGAVTYAGGINFNGNVTVGDSSADTLTINSTITSNLIFTDNTYDIGVNSTTNRPRNLFLAGYAYLGGGAVSNSDILFLNNAATGLTAKYIQSNAFGGTIRLSANGSTATDRNVQLGVVNNVGTFAPYFEVGDNYVTVQGLNLGRGGASLQSNSVLGYQALNSNTTGANNVAVGSQTLINNTTGSYNTAVGYQAGYSNTADSGVTAVGWTALYANTTGTNNTGVGQQALKANTTGANNSSLGHNSLLANTTGGNNTAIGQGSLFSNTTASNNTALGYQASYSNTTGTRNTAVGMQSLYTNTTLNDNTAIGYQSQYAITGQQNTTLGTYAFYSGTGNDNVAIGYLAMGDSGKNGNANVAIGSSALQKATTANTNIAIGGSAMANTTTGAQNTAVGYQAMSANTTGLYNTAYGFQAGLNSQTASNNTWIGYAAGRDNTSGTQNAYIGRVSGLSTTSGSYNTGVGDAALYRNTTGSYNIAIGGDTLSNVITGNYNTAVGYQAGYNVTNQFNTFVGYQAGYTNASGYRNVAIGALAGYSNSSSLYNTFLGEEAGYATTGGQNTFVGFSSGSLITSGTKNTIIGLYNGNNGGLDIRTSNNYIVLADGDGNPRAYHNGYNWNSGTGGFISKQGQTYSNSFATVTSWGSNFNTVIPVGTLARGQTYLINLVWNYQDGNQPYYLDATMIFTATNTNGTDGNNAVDLISVTHTGASSYYYTVRGVAGSFSTTGLQVKLTNVVNPNGVLYVYAVQISTGA